jgi:hypothetical protein
MESSWAMAGQDKASRKARPQERKGKEETYYRVLGKYGKAEKS